MAINRNSFFFGILLLITVPVLGYKVLWLMRAKKSTATFAFHGKEISGQLESKHAVMFFTADNDTVFFNAVDNPTYSKGDQFPILYQPTNPQQASLINFDDLWMQTVILWGVPFIFLLIVFLHREIVPYNSKIELSTKAPWIKVVISNSRQ